MKGEEARVPWLRCDSLFVNGVGVQRGKRGKKMGKVVSFFSAAEGE